MENKNEMKETKLFTGITITYEDNGNIKTCVSLYDNAVTNKPLIKNN